MVCTTSSKNHLSLFKVSADKTGMPKNLSTAPESDPEVASEGEKHVPAPRPASIQTSAGGKVAQVSPCCRALPASVWPWRCGRGDGAFRRGRGDGAIRGRASHCPADHASLTGKSASDFFPRLVQLLWLFCEKADLNTIFETNKNMKKKTLLTPATTSLIRHCPRAPCTRASQSSGPDDTGPRVIPIPWIKTWDTEGQVNGSRSHSKRKSQHSSSGKMVPEHAVYSPLPTKTAPSRENRIRKGSCAPRRPQGLTGTMEELKTKEEE